MPKVSVIIPIYNNEKYIERCLDSLAAQTLGDIQVLMINDGSMDATETICQRYAAQYPNFEYFYKENGGSASARNVGLEHATGEYIGFVDSDDYVEHTMFAKLYAAAMEHGGADMVFNPMKKKNSFTHPVPGFYDRKGMEKYIFPNLLPHPTNSGTFRSFDWGNWSKLMVMLEEEKTMPFGEIWNEYCRRCGKPEDGQWFDKVLKYEQEVQLKRI